MARQQPDGNPLGFRRRHAGYKRVGDNPEPGCRQLHRGGDHLRRRTDRQLHPDGERPGRHHRPGPQRRGVRSGAHGGRDGLRHLGRGLRIRGANRQLRPLLHLHRGPRLRRHHHVGPDLGGCRHIPEPVARQQPDGNPLGFRRRHAGYKRVGDNPEPGCRQLHRGGDHLRRRTDRQLHPDGERPGRHHRPGSQRRGVRSSAHGGRDGLRHLGRGLRIRGANRQLRPLLHLHRGPRLRRHHHVGPDLGGCRHIPEPVARQQPDGNPLGFRRRHAGYKRVGDNPEPGCRQLHRGGDHLRRRTDRQLHPDGERPGRHHRPGSQRRGVRSGAHGGRDGLRHLGRGLRIRGANRQLRPLLHPHRGPRLRRDHHVGPDLGGGRHIPEPVVQAATGREPPWIPTTTRRIQAGRR